MNCAKIRLVCKGKMGYNRDGIITGLRIFTGEYGSRISKYCKSIVQSTCMETTSRRVILIQETPIYLNLVRVLAAGR